MSQPNLVVTGFEPYGGRGSNPSLEVARLLGGTEVGGAPVKAHILPVELSGLRERIDAILAEDKPAVVLSLGLWPGQPVPRLERVALNLADYPIPDNAGVSVIDQPLDGESAAAYLSGLPLRAIESSLLAAGIPIELSNTAGTFLCNATLYEFLRALGGRRDQVPCGFMHLPYLPVQVAELMAGIREKRHIELHQRSDLASMSLELMVQAARIALSVSYQSTRSSDRTA